ncbi:MAG TPA: cytochrome c4 [Polaromonas sp.]|uniref:c-type cytochrome n=1 Tax=Polaromonas sp. TaxID=1869339 RepID=UPI002D454016|nr:cytochrome c4 [Polaromonas sp.]HYW58582.1 cytochrome c4 [Polaromonas sp.]
MNEDRLALSTQFADRVMRTMLRLATAAVLFAGAGALHAQTLPVETTVPAVQDTMAQRMQACVVCHGREGRATNQGYFPRIAGKPAGYLYNQLQNFKLGLRRYEAMNHLVQHMSDDYLRDIARYFSQLDLPYPSAKASTLTSAEQRMAENLVLRGAPDRGLAACTTCHGSQMAGMMPAMPGLLTLPADYLVAQLGAWRTGNRKATAPDCMAEVARLLTPEEVSVMAKWLSAQTLPSGTHPAPPSRQALPMRCGGLNP